MAGQDGVAPAEKQMKKNVGRAKIKRKQKNSDNPDVDVTKSGSPRKQRRKRGDIAKKTEDQNAEDLTMNKEPDENVVSKSGPSKKQRRKKEETAEKTEGQNAEEVSVIKEPDKRGLWNAALEAGRIGAKAFGLFLRSQRMWSVKPLEKSTAEKFRGTCKEFGFDARFILPHSPYLMNLGSPKPDVRQKSRDMLVDELSRCHQLGLTLYNIHPGSHLGEMPVNKCLELIAEGINHAHSQIPDITVVLENMSCQGSTVGGRFEELRGIIDLVKDKTRIGVCLDTCHAFAAGHNLSEEKGLKHMLDEFDKVVGLLYLRAVHLNDSKGKVGCRLDRHENIGQGHIGVKGFRQVMNEPRFNEIPMILETPYTADFDEIELLYSLCVEGATTKRL
ncbi:putative endonuclease 4 isoform X13 [Lithobates pipiens]